MIAVVEYWRCLNCEEHGQGPKSDLHARKHLEATGHGTVSGSRPATTTTGHGADA